MKIYKCLLCGECMVGKDDVCIDIHYIVNHGDISYDEYVNNYVKEIKD